MPLHATQLLPLSTPALCALPGGSLSTLTSSASGTVFPGAAHYSRTSKAPLGLQALLTSTRSVGRVAERFRALSRLKEQVRGVLAPSASVRSLLARSRGSTVQRGHHHQFSSSSQSFSLQLVVCWRSSHLTGANAPNFQGNASCAR